METGGNGCSWVSGKWDWGGWAGRWFLPGRRTHGCGLDFPEESALPEFSHEFCYVCGMILVMLGPKWANKPIYHMTPMKGKL